MYIYMVFYLPIIPFCNYMSIEIFLKDFLIGGSKCLLSVYLRSFCIFREWIFPVFVYSYTSLVSLSPYRTLEWHQDYFSSKDSLVLRPCVQDRIALRYNALRLAASSSHLYGNDLQHIAAVGLFNLRSYPHRLSSSPHQTPTELNDSFTRFYCTVTNTFSFFRNAHLFDQNILR